jgi:hypothetical protein
MLLGKDLAAIPGLFLAHVPDKEHAKPNCHTEHESYDGNAHQAIVGGKQVAE